MKLIDRNCTYKINSEQEYEKIVEFIKNNNLSTDNIDYIPDIGYYFLYSRLDCKLFINKEPKGEIIDSFKEWCRKTIEGYIEDDFEIGDEVELVWDIGKSLSNPEGCPPMQIYRGKIEDFGSTRCFFRIENAPMNYHKDHFRIVEKANKKQEVKQEEPINKFKVGDKVKFVKGGKIDWELLEYTIEDCLVIGNIYQIKEISSSGNIQLIEGDIGYFHHSNHFELHQETKEEVKDELFIKEGNKYTIKHGYKGAHPFKIGQKVNVHEGSNIGDRDFIGKIESIRDQHKVELRVNDLSNKENYRYCYACGDRNLIVTILEDVEEKSNNPPCPYVAGMDNWRNREKIPECVTTIYKNHPLTPEECYKPKDKKPKPDYSLQKDNTPNIELNIKKKTKPNYSLI